MLAGENAYVLSFRRVACSGVLPLRKHRGDLRELRHGALLPERRVGVCACRRMDFGHRKRSETRRHGEPPRPGRIARGRERSRTGGDRYDRVDGTGRVRSRGHYRVRVAAGQLDNLARPGAREGRPGRVCRATGRNRPQQATELGVDGVIPWAAQRSIVRWEGNKVAKGRQCWSAIVREASKQS